MKNITLSKRKSFMHVLLLSKYFGLFTIKCGQQGLNESDKEKKHVTFKRFPDTNVQDKFSRVLKR
ncbi:hypothetical protein DERP_015364 [Dermatophagoides pteronyssinus]|uniref:Uncharacterized protein n=1 Tax=Dermatophagoides pteronyssinus TaxID=6956 RepID=A0ABQ8JAT4_DERPT|nr:hypothetical protein DERP_015364 [Dermatophagoides pteronyssinus]